RNELLVHARERLAHRLQQFGDGLLPRREVAGRCLLKLSELFLRELQERLLTALQRCGRQRFERVFELLLRVGDERKLFGGRGTFGLERRAQCRALTGQRFDAAERLRDLLPRLAELTLEVDDATGVLG